MPTKKNTESQQYFSSKIAAAIQATMDNHCLTRKAFARRLGVSTQAVADLLSPENMPTSLWAIGKLVDLTEDPVPLCEALIWLADRDLEVVKKPVYEPANDGETAVDDCSQALQSVALSINMALKALSGQDVNGDGKYDRSDDLLAIQHIENAQKQLADVKRRLENRV